MLGPITSSCRCLCIRGIFDGGAPASFLPREQELFPCVLSGCPLLPEVGVMSVMACYSSNFGFSISEYITALLRSKSAAISAPEASFCPGVHFSNFGEGVGVSDCRGGFVVFPIFAAVPGCTMRGLALFLRVSMCRPCSVCARCSTAGRETGAFRGAGSSEVDKSGSPGICGHAGHPDGVGFDAVSAGRSAFSSGGAADRARAFRPREAMVAAKITTIHMSVEKSSTAP